MEELLRALEVPLGHEGPRGREVPLESEGLDARLPGVPQDDVRSGELLVDPGATLREVDCASGAPGEVEGTAEVPRGLRLLGALEEGAGEG